jgi:NAD(P)-dependent dehydrogenase (short-subunit alcohol dehydrogenase family)
MSATKIGLVGAKRVALIVGAGDALGGAIARRFAAGGYTVCVTRRSADKLANLKAQIEREGGTCYAYGCDAREEEPMLAMFTEIERDIGPIEVCVFNIGGNVNFKITETTSRVYRKVWEMCALAGFLTGREAAKVMQSRQTGTIIFTGATASLRGGVGFAAFAGGKHALRALAQSMARELGPQGIHVAHTIIDGAIDTEFIKTNFPARYAMKDQDGILNPEHIAESYWMLHQQPRDAWTHELDLRPWLEKW